MSTVKMNKIFEKFIQFYVRYEIFVIFKILINVHISSHC